MKRLIFTLFALMLCISLYAQENLLKRGFEGRTVPDEIKREYLIPLRLVEIPPELTTGTVNPEVLLTRAEERLAVNPPACKTILSTKNGKQASVLLDFGKEIYGGLEISARFRDDKMPVRVRIRFGESVSETFSDALGRTDFEVPMATATNDHSLRDLTLEIPWLGTVEIGSTGFRFVRIDLVDEETVLPLSSVRAILRYRDIPYVGSFRCSDNRLNDIWDTGAYTTHLCMQEQLWDGVKRDRLVWLGDMHPELMTINSVFGTNPVVAKSLDFARDMTPQPGWINDIPSYSMWWLLCHRDLYMYGGDLEYLGEQHSYVKGLLRQIISQSPDGREAFEGWRFLDWPTARNNDVIHAGYQAMLRMSLEVGVEIGEWLGDAEMTGECSAALKKIKGYAPPHGGNKQAAALLALSEIEDAGRMSCEVIAKDGPDRFSTFYGYYMLEALAKGGMYSEAMDIISQYWGAMLDLGATSFWENLEWADVQKNPARIDEVVPAGRYDIHAEAGDHCYTGFRLSMCHGWASGPTAWLSRHVLGIEPLEPGCAKVRVVPNLGNLEWAEGTFPTPYGPITVRHEKDRNGKVISTIGAPPGLDIIQDSAD